MLNGSVDVSAKTVDGSTPLQLATLFDNKATINSLLAANADPNVLGVKIGTPLHNASLMGHTASAELLLIKAGGDASLEDYEGNTPRNLADRLKTSRTS